MLFNTTEFDFLALSNLSLQDSYFVLFCVLMPFQKYRRKRKTRGGGRKFGAGRVARWETCPASGGRVGKRARRMKHGRYFA